MENNTFVKYQRKRDTQGGEYEKEMRKKEWERKVERERDKEKEWKREREREMGEGVKGELEVRKSIIASTPLVVYLFMYYDNDACT